MSAMNHSQRVDWLFFDTGDDLLFLRVFCLGNPCAQRPYLGVLFQRWSLVLRRVHSYDPVRGTWFQPLSSVIFIPGPEAIRHKTFLARSYLISAQRHILFSQIFPDLQAAFAKTLSCRTYTTDPWLNGIHKHRLVIVSGLSFEIELRR